MADTIDSISIELTASTQSAENSIQRVIGMLRMLNAMTIDTAESKVSKSIRSIAKAAKEVDNDAGQKLARLAGGLSALSKVGNLDHLSGAAENIRKLSKAIGGVGNAGSLNSMADGLERVGKAAAALGNADIGSVRRAMSDMSGKGNSIGAEISRPKPVIEKNDFEDIERPKHDLTNDDYRWWEPILPDEEFSPWEQALNSNWLRFEPDNRKPAGFIWENVPRDEDGYPIISQSQRDEWAELDRRWANGERDRYPVNLDDFESPVAQQAGDLSGEMSGPLHEVTESARESERALEELMQQENSTAQQAGEMAQEISADAGGMSGEFEDLVSKNGELSGEFETLFEDATQGSKGMTEVGDKSKFANMSLEEMENTIGSVTDQLQAMAGTAETAGNAVQNAMNMPSIPPETGPYDPERIGQFDVSERFANFRMAPLEDDFAGTANAADGASESVQRLWFSFSGADIMKGLGGLFNSIAGGLLKLSGASGIASNALGILQNKAGGVIKAFSSYGLAAIPMFFGGKLVDSIKNATKSVVGFFNSVVRIAKYRAIRTMLKFITQGFADGLKNLYAWSQAMDGQFAKSMDTLATASKYTGNSMAAMVSPLINAVAPAIDFIVDKLVDMFNWFNQIFARLSGETSYTAAKKVATQWQDASENAAGSAKKAADEIKRTILGFDEINKLNGDTDSGTGRGSGNGAQLDANNMFEKRAIEGSVSSFADTLRSAFERADWKGLGEALGGKVNELVGKIDFAGMGKKVGESINAWFSTKYWTLDTINFTNIGSKIAEFLNNAISKIDFGIIGRSLVQKFTILADLAIGFFETFDWGQAASSLSAFVSGIYRELAKWLEKTDWRKLGDSIIKSLVDFFTNLNIGQLSSSIMEFIGAALGAAMALNQGILKGIGESLLNALNSVVDFFKKEIEDCGGNILLGILKGIADGLINIGKWIVDNIFKPFLNGLMKAFGIASPAKKMEEPGRNILLGIYEGIKKAIADVGNWVKENILDPIWNAIMDSPLGWVINISVGLVKDVGNWAADAWTVVKDKSAEFVQNVKAKLTKWGEWASDVWSVVKDKSAEFVQNVKAKLTKWGEWASDVWSVVKDKSAEFIQTVKAKLVEGVGWVGAMWDFLKTKGEQVKNVVADIAIKIGGVLWDGITSLWDMLFPPDNAPTVDVKVDEKTREISAALDSGDKDRINAVTSKYGQDAVDDVYRSPSTSEFLRSTGRNLGLLDSLLELFEPTAYAEDDSGAMAKAQAAQTANAFRKMFDGTDKNTTMVGRVGGNLVGSATKLTKALTENTNATKVDSNGYLPFTFGTATQAEFNSAWGEFVGDGFNVNATVDFSPKDSTVGADKNRGMLGYLKEIFAPGTDTETRVQLKKKDEKQTPDTLFNTSKVLEVFALLFKKDGNQSSGNLFGTAISVFASLFKRDGNQSSGNLFGTAISVFASLFKNDGNQSAGNLFGTVISVFASLFKNDGNQNSGNLFGTIISVLASLSKQYSSQSSAGLFGTMLAVLATLAKADPNASSGMLFGTGIGVKAGLEKKDRIQSSGWLFGENFTTSARLAVASNSADNVTSLFGNQVFAKGFLNKGTSNDDINKVFGGNVLTVTAKLKADKSTFLTVTGEKLKDGMVKLGFAAEGGIFENGVWRNIPQYASGTLNAHGSLFMAGEAGPEIVGHVGGRTEVLNKSQLAATMYAAVHSAMQGVRIDGMFYDGSTDGNDGTDYDTMYRAMYDAFTAAMARGDERDVEKVALLRQISEKDFTANVSTADINRGQRYMNRRAGVTVVPVNG